MNYVIINGKKSTLIKGLLIQSLPPVTKPQMRVKTEEIDGRDGDVCAKLGYKAYEKEMSIGLFGDFDIDEVIEYFNASGTIIFSNEMDKFYQFEQLKQIDFERLARFKTAKVQFHVQPFKYSAVDDYFTVDTDLMRVRPSEQTVHNVKVTSANNVISIEGTSNRSAEAYIAINPITLPAGDYTLYAETSGTGNDHCKMRLIEDLPTDADSFGGTEFDLENDVTDAETLTETNTYKYIWLYFDNGVSFDFDLSVRLIDENISGISVLNRGNVYSRPKLTIYGSGTVTISVNGSLLFTIALATDGYIVIDGEEMEAYKGDVLKNRSVSGDYSRLVLPAGANTISWTGDVSRLDVENVSRWV